MNYISAINNYHGYLIFHMITEKNIFSKKQRTIFYTQNDNNVYKIESMLMKAMERNTLKG